MRTRLLGMAIIPAALLALAACSGDETPAGPTTATGTTTSAAGGPPSTAPGGAATRVEVTENEYTIVLPRTDLSPGTYTFVVANTGAEPHDLWINGPGIDNAKTETLDGGSRGEVTAALQPGTYELWCSIGNHREQGMELTLTVAG